MTERALHTILYVEDDPDIQAVARLALEALGGFSMQILSSGAAALAYLRTQQPDLIILDVKLPGMDGPAILKALQQSPATSDIPVMFMTATSQADELDNLQQLGVLGIISKPFDPMTLAAEVRSHWHRLAQQVIG